MSPQSSPKIEIRIATLEDREILVKLYLNLLKFLDQFEHDMLPTRENAEWITDATFLPAAMRGEAILIAWEGDKPIAGLFWPVQIIPYQCRWKMAFGYGIYIEESHRGKNLSTLLRKKAVEILKSKEVQKLIAMRHFKNKTSLAMSDRFGVIPFARVDLLDI